MSEFLKKTQYDSRFIFKLKKSVLILYQNTSDFIEDHFSIKIMNVTVKYLLKTTSFYLVTKHTKSNKPIT